MTLLFKPAEVTTAYLKTALMGFQGSGKTYTGTSMAIGLVKLMRQLKLSAASKPLAFIDTEKGSDWIKPRVNAAGIDLVTAKTRAFSDLLKAVPEAEANASVLLIDSLTHFWVELCETYSRMKAKEFRRASYRLQFQDWAYLKAEWRRFTDLFVNSRVHIIACGRAGYEYDYFEGDDGKKQLEKTGIKMKAEGEMGYEPDLLVLMERRMNMDTKADEHIAHVVKDRSTLLDGKEFPDPTFENFLPHIRCLNLGGKHLGVDASRTSESIIPADPREDKRVQRKIVLDEIESLLVLHHPSTGGNDKKAKVALLRKHFRDAAWAEIEEVMPLADLRAGYDAMHIELEGKPSRYNRQVVEAAAAAALDKAAVDQAEASPPADTGAGNQAELETAIAGPAAAETEASTVAGPGLAGADPEPGGMPDLPKFLRRRSAAPADVVDEAAWLTGLMREFDACADLEAIKRRHAELVKPQRDRVSAETWTRADAIAHDAITRVTKDLLAA